MTKIPTLYSDYRECMLDLDIYGKIVATPQQSIQELTETLFEEFQRRKPMPTLECKRYELSRLVNPDFRIAYNKELELQDNERLLDLQSDLEASFENIDFEDLTSLIPTTKELFSYENHVTDDMRNEIISKYDLSTGEEFKPGIKQTENIVGSVSENDDLVLSEEKIKTLGVDESEEEITMAEDPMEVVSFKNKAEEVTYEADDDEVTYGADEDSEEVFDYDSDDERLESDDESSDDYSNDEDDSEDYDSDAEDLEDYDSDDEDSEDYNDDDEDIEDYDSDDEDSSDDEDDDYGSDEDDVEDYDSDDEDLEDYSSDDDSDDEDLEDYSSDDEDSENDEEDSEDNEDDYSSDEEDSEDYDDDEEDSEDYDDYGSEDENTINPTVEVIKSDGVATEQSSFDLDDDFDVDSFISSNQEQPSTIQSEHIINKVVETPITPIEVRNNNPPQSEIIDRSAEPTEIRAFLRKHPRCEYEFALKYFTKKQINDAIKIGKIIKKGNILKI